MMFFQSVTKYVPIRFLLLIPFIFLACSDDESNEPDNPENVAPVVSSALVDLILTAGFETAIVDLSSVFSDADNDALTYTVSSSNVDIATVFVSETSLTIVEVGVGTSTITVTADDQNGGSVSDEFELSINEAITFSDELTMIFEQACEDGLNPGNLGDKIFVERDSFLIMEAEDAYYSGDEGNWSFKTDTTGFSGAGYYQWVNSDGTWNGGLITRSSQLWFNIYISTPGTYIVSVRGKINIGNNDSEHNDVWLKVNGADDFYAYRNQGGVDNFRRPADIADPDTPGEPTAADRGYMKAYNKTLGRWSYETRNVDFGEYNIFAEFDEPGIRSVVLAGKVTGFAVDQVVLIRDPAWQNYNRLTNKIAVLSQTANKAEYECEN